MPVWQTALLVIGIVIVGGMAGVWLLTKTAIRKAARNIIEIQRRINSGRHEFRLVDASQFSHLDLAFYDETRDWLARRGFTFVADLEDVTMSEFMADARLQPAGTAKPTFIRVMTSADATVQAGLWHSMQPTVERRDGRLHKTVLEHKIIEFMTDFDDGTAVCTSPQTAAALGDEPPEIRRYFLAADTPREELLERHDTQVTSVLSMWKAVAPICIRTAEELIDSLHRAQDLKAAFRKERGLVSLAELQRMSGDSSNLFAEWVKREIERQLAKERPPRG